MLKEQKKIVSGILIFLVGANILSWLAVYNAGEARFLEVNFFDVGQGDAILI